MTETVTDELQLLPKEHEFEPFYFTRTMLRELGGCGPYIRTHARLFPTIEYPDGVAINTVTCRRYASDFDWHWATSELLEWNGRREVERIMESRAREYQPLRAVPRDQRYAAVFGYVFATRPELRSTRLRQLDANRAQHAEDEIKRDLEEVRETITQATAEVERWTKIRDEATAQLPGIEDAIRTIGTRIAQARAEEKQRQVEAAKTALARLQREAAAAVEEAERLAAAVEPGTEVETTS